MALEIERKFLVRKDVWSAVDKPVGQYYRQGYVSTDPEKTLRVRIVESKAYLTLKGISVGAKRLEYEFEIPIEDAKEILKEFTVSMISKIRYKINYKGKVWEVDEFLEENSGLILAELELSSEDEKFDLPDWIDKEVTGDSRYFNSNLSMRSYKKY